MNRCVITAYFFCFNSFISCKPFTFVTQEAGTLQAFKAIWPPPMLMQKREDKEK